MLSVVIPGFGPEEGLARTLASLVPAAAEGIVREVVVVDDGRSGDGGAAVADAAGCVVTRESGDWDARLRAGIAAVRRGHWVLVLPSSVLLEGDWYREVAAFVERADRRGVTGEAVGTFRLEVDAFGWRARVAEAVIGFCNIVLGMPTAEQGLVMSKRQWEAVLSSRRRLRRHTDLVRRLGRRRIHRLRVCAVAAIVDGAPPPAVTSAGVARHVLAALGLSVLVPDGR
jgi:hypothetical protein